MGNPGTGRVKLRSTCDRCAALKVRCDKGKPRCERCQASGSECAYGPYRWKTRAPSNPMTRERLYRQVVGTQPGDMSLAYPQQSAIGSSEMNITSDGPTTTFPGFSGACTPTPTYTSNDFGQNRYDRSSLPDFSHFNFPDVSNELSEPNSIISSLFADSNPEIYEMSTPETEGEPLIPIPSPNSCSCADTALGIAEDLYRGALCGPTPNGLILKVNREVVRKLDQLLVEGQCTYSHEPSLLFMLASIISKSLDWYQVIFHEISQPPKNNNNNNNNPNAAAAAPETVPTTPIQFGEFKLNPEEQRRMEAQFLLCELQSLRRVLGMLAKNAVDRDRYHGTLADPLHEFLRLALDRLMADVNSFCVFRPPRRNPG